MKDIWKFTQNFILVCFFYLFAYITFFLFSASRHIQPYLVPFLFIFAMILCWFILGIISPKNLTILKVKSRFLVIIISIFAIFALLCAMLFVEKKIYRQDPIEGLIINGYKVFLVLKNINPIAQKFKQNKNT
jgi:4-amino-4-deoxy-L-arabinose transferase-like glycosyltransferase